VFTEGLNIFCFS